MPHALSAEELQDLLTLLEHVLRALTGASCHAFPAKSGLLLRHANPEQIDPARSSIRHAAAGLVSIEAVDAVEPDAVNEYRELDLDSVDFGMQIARLEPDWLTKLEAAQRARVSVSTIERAIRAGELEAGGTTGLVRIRPAAVDAWLEHRTRSRG